MKILMWRWRIGNYFPDFVNNLKTVILLENRISHILKILLKNFRGDVLVTNFIHYAAIAKQSEKLMKKFIYAFSFCTAKTSS